jgi:hypothetical protein
MRFLKPQSDAKQFASLIIDTDLLYNNQTQSKKENALEKYDLREPGSLAKLTEGYLYALDHITDAPKFTPIEQEFAEKLYEKISHGLSDLTESGPKWQPETTNEYGGYTLSLPFIDVNEPDGTFKVNEKNLLRGVQMLIRGHKIEYGADNNKKEYQNKIDYAINLRFGTTNSLLQEIYNNSKNTLELEEKQKRIQVIKESIKAKMQNINELTPNKEVKRLEEEIFALYKEELEILADAIKKIQTLKS